MDLAQLGKIFLAAGCIMLVIGLLFILGGRIPYIGKLSGDILIQKKNFTFYFPLATSLIVSAVLSFLFWLVSRR